MVGANAEDIVERIERQIDRYERAPFTRGIAEILVVCNYIRFELIQTLMYKQGAHGSIIGGYVQRRNVIVRWVSPDVPFNKVRGCTCALVLLDYNIPLSEDQRTLLINTLMSAQMAGMEGSELELI